jgi:hypothetical protein
LIHEVESTTYTSKRKCPLGMHLNEYLEEDRSDDEVVRSGYNV